MKMSIPPTHPALTDKWFWLVISAIVVTIGCGVTAVWIGTDPTTRLVKIVETTAAMLAASGVVLATYLNIKQSRETLRRLAEDNHRTEKLRLEQLERDKLEETFRLIEKWDDPHYLEARKFSRELGKDVKNLTPDALIKKVNEDPSLRSSVGLMLNYFDYIRLSLKHERVHAELIKAQLAPVAILTLDRFGSWIATLEPTYRKDIDEFRKLIT